ncbi:MAG: hypothetical protein EVJ46_06100 [Candidatus Acididesulfobacter guangdongensis]|jgi:metal-responsive CopG/Arc/MetJ family transcriptional regulator|uniref:Uncharacterized protein n=1 Tax=Acididesulfobacter guangdongensis TaxID=2597225 RepID=A0A519BH23_ACIG2|nr:MAG: hypothetical protein EVJ46_06100 [Candidatus Acididesulfobacter guangdongensis]
MSKKDCHVYIDERFIRKIGMENKSKIVNDALKKYYTEEREYYKNDLQIIKDFSDTINNLTSAINKQQIEIQKLHIKTDFVFNMALWGAYSADIILEENNKKIITTEVEKLKEQYQKFKEFKEEKL